MLGKLDLAVASYRRALALDASLPQANQNLAAITADPAQAAGAVAGYLRHLRQNPGRRGGAQQPRQRLPRARPAPRCACQLRCGDRLRSGVRRSAFQPRAAAAAVRRLRRGLAGTRMALAGEGARHADAGLPAAALGRRSDAREDAAAARRAGPGRHDPVHPLCAAGGAALRHAGPAVPAPDRGAARRDLRASQASSCRARRCPNSTRTFR